MPGKLSGMENMAAQYQPSDPTQSWGTASNNGQTGQTVASAQQQSPYQNQAPWQAPYKAPQQQNPYGQPQFANQNYTKGDGQFGDISGLNSSMIGGNMYDPSNPTMNQMGPNALSGQMSASERQQNPYQKSSMPTQAQGIPQGGPRMPMGRTADPNRSMDRSMIGGNMYDPNNPTMNVGSNPWGGDPNRYQGEVAGQQGGLLDQQKKMASIVRDPLSAKGTGQYSLRGNPTTDYADRNMLQNK